MALAQNPLLYNALVTSAAKIAETEVLGQVNTYLTIGGTAAAIIAFIIGFLGFAQVRDIKQSLASDIRNEIETNLRSSADFRRSIRSEIETDVLSTINRDILRLERIINIGRLSSLTQKVSESESFTNAERDSILQSLILLKDDQDIVATPEYVDALKLTLVSFYRAAQWPELDKLDAMLGETIVRHPQMIFPMLEGFGLRSLGQVGLTAEQSAHYDARMLYYAKSLAAINYPEVGYQYLLAFEVWKNGRTELSDRLITACFDMPDADRLRFLAGMRRGADPNNLAADGQVRSNQALFAEKYRAVAELYADDLTRLEGSVGTPPAGN